MLPKSKKYKGKILFFILFIFSNALFVSAQVPPSTPRVEPVPKSTITPPNVVVTPKPPKNNDWKTKKTIINESETPAEKSIVVDAKVKIQFCVKVGKVTVNGWDRNEIRAFVSGGSEVGFKVVQRSRQNNNPVWVKAVGFNPEKNYEADAEECLSGEEIEFDVPRGAIVDIKSDESETNVESVRKAIVRNLGGNIFLNDIAEGIQAITHQGGITVEKSSGAINLNTTAGNIIALDVSSSEIGDIFRARTNNGTILLRNVEQRQVEVGSISGAINFNGEFFSGGQYRFSTQNGSISLAIPEKSSCLVNATYGFGAFNSELPLQNVKHVNPSGVKNLTGQLGSGDATLNLTTSYGRINIKKQ